MNHRKVIRASGPNQLVELTVAVRVRGGWVHEKVSYNPRQVTRKELATMIRAVRSGLRAVAFQIDAFESRFIEVQNRNDAHRPGWVCK